MIVERPLHFERAFGQMHLDGNIGVIGGPLGDALHDLEAGGVGRVRRNRGRDQRMTRELGDQFFDAGKAFVEILMIGWCEIGEGLADNGAQSRLGSDAADFGFKVIHVSDGGHAALDHFEGGESGANPDHVGRDELAFERQDIAIEPVIDVFAKAAEH